VVRGRARTLSVRDVIWRPTKVLFLGAGVSFRAGYPLASDLLPTIEATAVQSKSSIQKAWSKWKSFRDAASGPLALALRHTNPEVVLSQIDLLETTKGHFDDHFVEGRAEEAFQKMIADEEVPSEYFKSAADEEIWRVEPTNDNLIFATSSKVNETLLFRSPRHYRTPARNPAHGKRRDEPWT
jgi:hypothetical protein